MPYTLEAFAADCKSTLVAQSGPEGREKIRGMLERVFADEKFLRTNFGTAADSDRNVLYRDPDLGFCIVAHTYTESISANPHHHGPAWAIYGQAEGMTEMTDWRLVRAPEDGAAGKVAAERTYTLKPGDAHVYNEGDIHSPQWEGLTRLLRVEGQDMTTVQRDPLEPES